MFCEFDCRIEVFELEAAGEHRQQSHLFGITSRTKMKRGSKKGAIQVKGETHLLEEPRTGLEASLILSDSIAVSTVPFTAIVSFNR